jgi:hypothetical protein
VPIGVRIGGLPETIGFGFGAVGDNAGLLFVRRLDVFMDVSGCVLVVTTGIGLAATAGDAGLMLVRVLDPMAG